jgi:hypothetical protein
VSSRKKDHDCPHARPHPSGMEVCRTCGDFGICPECGSEYIKLDTGPICYPCTCLHRAARSLATEQRELAKRRKRNAWKDGAA